MFKPRQLFLLHSVRPMKRERERERLSHEEEEKKGVALWLKRPVVDL